MPKTEIQTVLIPKSKFKRYQAIEWIIDNGFKPIFNGKPYDETIKFFRFRQRRPVYQKYATKKLKNGIRLVFGIK